MKAILIASTFSIFLYCECLTLHSQIDLTKFEIGVNANGFIYQGDLTPSLLGSYRTIKPGFGFFVSKMLTPIFSVRTNLVFGKLKGDDAKYSHPAYRQQRNFNFKSQVFEISELLVANVFRENHFGISPYLFGGLGLSFLHIKRDWSNFNAEYFSAESSTITGLATDAQHSLPKSIPVIPLGIGIRYSISKNLSVNAETTYRIVFTDYLDGFSEAANPSKNDHYYTHSIGLIYSFGKKNSLNCPVIQN